MNKINMNKAKMGKINVGDLIDKISIIELKIKRLALDSAEVNSLYVEFDKIKKEFINIDWGFIYIALYKVNSNIWELEAGLKGGKELLVNPNYLDDVRNKKVLISIGKNAIMIRNNNAIRVALKNMINNFVGYGFKEIKGDHISE